MEDKKKISDVQNAGIAGASYEIVQRYGFANKQHFVAYNGVDNELGKNLVKGLKQVSKQKINPDYQFQNIHQQAGFSAEIKSVARTNAKNIISGSEFRKIRTDDLGNINDPFYDTVLLDSKGQVVDGSQVQMKFLGASQMDPTGVGAAERAFAKLQSSRFKKYLDHDVNIEVPNEQYDGIIDAANVKLEKLYMQLENRQKAGSAEQVEKIQKQIDKVNKIKKNLRKSDISSNEAVYAREHPRISTAKDIGKISHEAGLETAKNAAIIGGSISIIKNLVAFHKGEISIKGATENVAKDTAVTSVTGYMTGAVGATIKGAMQNSQKEYIRTISKTNVPGTIVAASVTSYKIFANYFRGEIDGLECLETLGEQGSGMLASAMYAAIAQSVIPIPIIGGMIGGMIGYTFSSAAYGVLISSLKEEKLAKEERAKLEKVCKEHVLMICECRKEVENVVNEYLSESETLFTDSFSGIKNALEIGDVDWFIENANNITEMFGGNVNFTDFTDFNNKVLQGTMFKL